MQPTYEQYRYGCQLLSILTNLEVQLFDTQRISQLRCARSALPQVLEDLKQQALVHILELPLVQDCVYLVRDVLHLQFLATGVWEGPDYRGALVVGPFTSQAYQPQLISQMSQEGRFPPVMQRQLQNSYNLLPMLDKAKQDAIGHFLINVVPLQMRRPHQMETVLPLSERPALPSSSDLKQARALVESRYEIANKLMHAIAKGDARELKHVMEETQRISWPSYYPQVPVRSMKNPRIAANTLFMRAAQSAGVHPLYLESMWRKFDRQIEQAQSIAELECLFDEMARAYSDLVGALALVGLPSLIQEAVTYIRFHLDQPLHLSQIAAALSVHPSYLSSAFKKALGMTLTAYINKLRIEEAKYLLDQADVSVTQVALAIGYTDSNYFSKVFTKLEHVTPHDYRKRNRLMSSREES